MSGPWRRAVTAWNRHCVSPSPAIELHHPMCWRRGRARPIDVASDDRIAALAANPATPVDACRSLIERNAAAVAVEVLRRSDVTDGLIDPVIAADRSWARRYRRHGLACVPRHPRRCHRGCHRASCVRTTRQCASSSHGRATWRARWSKASRRPRRDCSSHARRNPSVPFDSITRLLDDPDPTAAAANRTRTGSWREREAQLVNTAPHLAFHVKHVGS